MSIPASPIGGGEPLPLLHFVVDAALLRELGERLVGKSHIALAELVKNSYDADAKRVHIRFESDSIEIRDDGHGMSLASFKSYWLRIGTTHKQGQLTSPDGRSLTGSKGVGRLAVQFLSNKLELHTRSSSDAKILVANVDWDAAVAMGDLQKADVTYDERTTNTHLLDNGAHGTTIVLRGLKHEWNLQEMRNLANELWALQSPLGHDTNSPLKFDIQFSSFNPDLAAAFVGQYEAFLNLIWYARVAGHLVHLPGTSRLDVSLQFADADPTAQSFEFPDCNIHELDFEIRVYLTAQKQRRNVRIKDLRDYLATWGGIHLYDDGFRLPFYGSKESDWLGIERDHSHRLSAASLLPESMRVAKALSFLPTTSRLLGAVHISTSRERKIADESRRHHAPTEPIGRSSPPVPAPSRMPARQAERHKNSEPVSGDGATSAAPNSPRELPHLTILVTRDRLVHNSAYDDLTKILRTALHFYANEEARRRFADRDNQKPTASNHAQSVLEVLEQHRADIPETVYEKLADEVEATVNASKADESAMTAHVGLLAALATAGISALAYEHEVSKQLRLLQLLAAKAEGFTSASAEVRSFLSQLAVDIRGWVDRAQGTRSLFSSLTDKDNREVVGRLRARSTLQSIRDQVAVLLRDVVIDVSGVDEELRLPSGRHAEWSALFQNLFFNAANAMLDRAPKWIHVSSRSRGKVRELVVEDTGSGVDLDTAHELFEPFVRRLVVAPRNRSRVIGGTGLGLTIVRLLASSVNCNVAFGKPRSKFKTAFILSWSDLK